MHINNVAQVLRHCVTHPMKSYRRLQESVISGAVDHTQQYVKQFQGSGVQPPADFSYDPRYEGNSNPLWDYFQKHRSGPGIYKWTHYFELYTRHLSKFIGRSPHIVEVGIYSGGSLGMWHEYFGPGCRVTGIDIEDACRVYENDNTKVFIGDQADREFWRRFRKEVPPIDILIDDGGHSAIQQRVTLEETLTHLKPGGVFVCEDVHGVDNHFAAYAHRLTDRLNSPSVTDLQFDTIGAVAESQPFQEQIHSVHYYPFAIVFERNIHPVTEFRCPRHGTEWQPFGGSIPTTNEPTQA